MTLISMMLNINSCYRAHRLSEVQWKIIRRYMLSENVETETIGSEYEKNKRVMIRICQFLLVTDLSTL
jgi:hypothetical protein